MKRKAFFLIVILVCMVVGYNYLEGKSMPNVIILDKIKGDYSEVRFDHAKHVSLASKCGVCHHTHTQKTYESCNRCHQMTSELFKASARHSFVACSECHGQYDIKNPAVVSLKVAYHKKCFSCHRGIGEIGQSPKGCNTLCHSKKS